MLNESRFIIDLGNPFTIKFITEILTLGIILTLAIYHFIIYLGRIKHRQEKYNLYFSIFAFSTGLFVLVNSVLFNFIFKNTFDFFMPSTEALLITLMFFSISNYLVLLIEKLNKIKKIIDILNIMMFISVILTFFIFIKGYDWYIKHLFIFAVIIVALCYIVFFVLIIIHIIKYKLYRNLNTHLVLLGFIIILFYLIIKKLLISINAVNYFFGNSLTIGFAIFIFAYVLAKKFNNEYHSLEELKDNLENKVDQRTKELTDAYTKIESVNNQKTNFFVNLAHETKTPLTLIQNYLNLYIKKYGSNEEVEIIKYNINKLTDDMVNFLDTQKIEQGKEFYNHEQITDISTLLKNIVPIYKSYANNKKIELSSQIEDGCFLKSDPQAINRVINNLVSNAIKFTDKNGNIDIKLESNNKKIILSVKDTGIGIDDNQIENIFKPYYQINHEKQNYQGIGMGLYITYKIVEELNGKIEVISNLSQGTLFNIYFNKEEKIFTDTKNEYSLEINILNPLNLKNVNETYNKIKKNILIVEDNQQLLNYLLIELSEQYNIFTASNGSDGLNKLSIIPHPHCIISDIMMDKMNGVEFFENISKNEMFNSIPFIFITAKSFIDDKITQISKGAIDYITKPFNIDVLKAKISSIIKHSDTLRKSVIKSNIDLLTKHLNSNENNYNNEKTEIFNRFESKCKEYNITERQKEILTLINQGLEYKEIGEKLEISTKTVIRHIQNLFEKTNVHTKLELINIFFR